MKACEQRGKLKYVVALSEVSAVPMADGYARATRSLGVVNLHVAPGLGNGMGTLYTAGIAGTPLLVLVGGQDRRFLHTNPILWGPVEKMAGAVCKAVFMLNTTFDAAANIRRALRAALTPPYGPVALICPPDLLETYIDAKPASVTPATLAALDKAQVAAYAKFLSSAKNPAIIAAEDVHWDNASGELEKLAAALGAPVYAAPYTGVLPVSSTSKVYAGYLPPRCRKRKRGSAMSHPRRHPVVMRANTRWRRSLTSNPRWPPSRPPCANAHPAASPRVQRSICPRATPLCCTPRSPYTHC